MGNETFPEESKVTLSILELGKDSPLYEDMTDILDRKQSGQLKFYTHEKVWDE